MTKIVKAAALQFDTKTGLIEENISYVTEKISALDADIVVLPEMWPCGFNYQDLKGDAEKTPYVLEKISELAVKKDIVIAGTCPELEGSDIYNTSYIVDKDGEIKGSYRKAHLFSPAGENKHFKAGRSVAVTDTSIGRIGHMICYDLRFPEFCRTLALNGAQIVVVMAQWPKVRVDHWNKLLAARAIENQLFIIGSNRIGVENLIEYNGNSKILSPNGKTLSFAYSFETDIEAELDFEEMEDFRKAVPCFDERMKEIYNL